MTTLKREIRVGFIIYPLFMGLIVAKRIEHFVKLLQRIHHQFFSQNGAMEVAVFCPKGGHVDTL